MLHQVPNPLENSDRSPNDIYIRPHGQEIVTMTDYLRSIGGQAMDDVFIEQTPGEVEVLLAYDVDPRVESGEYALPAVNSKRQDPYERAIRSIRPDTTQETDDRTYGKMDHGSSRVGDRTARKSRLKK